MHRYLLGNHAIERVPPHWQMSNFREVGTGAGNHYGTTPNDSSERARARQGEAGRNPEKLKFCGPGKLRGWRRGGEGQDARFSGFQKNTASPLRNSGGRRQGRVAR